MEAPKITEAPSEKRSGHLLVRVGEQICAVPVGAVRRVVRALTVHPLPGARAELAGLAEFGGEPLPVLDLGRLIGAPIGPHPLFPVTVVVWSRTGDGREAIGLAADEALEVVDLAAASWLPAAGFLIGEALVGDQVVRVLDPDQLGAGVVIPASYLLFHRGGGLWGIDSGHVARIGSGAENLRVELAPGPIVLAADRVEGVVAGLAVRPMSAALRTFWPEAGFGVALYSGRPVILLDPLHLPLPLVASGGSDA